MQTLMADDSFQHILRVLNTNVGEASQLGFASGASSRTQERQCEAKPCNPCAADGKEKIMYALTSIKGIGRRFADLCCKKAEVDKGKR